MDARNGMVLWRGWVQIIWSALGRMVTFVIGDGLQKSVTGRELGAYSCNYGLCRLWAGLGKGWQGSPRKLRYCFKGPWPVVV